MEVLLRWAGAPSIALTPALFVRAQFEALRTQLMSDEKHREIVQTIDFPPQRWFGKLKQSTVDERVSGLGAWLSVRAIDPTPAFLRAPAPSAHSVAAAALAKNSPDLGCRLCALCRK